MDLQRLLCSGLLVGNALAFGCRESAQAPPIATPARSEGATLEFRILADRKRDARVVAQAEHPEGLNRPPIGYRWASLGETVTGTTPTFSGTTLEDSSKSWARGRYAGQTVSLFSKDAQGADLMETITIRENRGHSLVLEKAPAMKKVDLYAIEYRPGGLEGHPDFIQREEPAANGVVKRWVLVKLDPQNVGEADLERVSIVQDERNQPAIDFKLNAEAAKRFGQLTREHLPQDAGLFKYRLAILIDNEVMSAPAINAEIRDRGIIELGNRPDPGEAERLLRLLKP